MALAAYHCQKGTASGGGGLGNHIDREEGKEHTYKSADPNKTHLNRNFEVTDYCKMPLEKAVSKRIEDAYTGKRAVRKDAVKHINHMLTGSHDQMKKIFSNKDTAQAWTQANLDFIAENFGAANIVRFTLHLDEKTPHIHCVTVPITEKGGLSAKEVMGNRVKLQQIQTKYAEKMKPFGLERGRSNPNIKHQDTKEFYKDMRAELDEREEERKEHQVKISELKSTEDELQSTIGSLTTKDMLVNIFQPKKKLRSTEEELKEVLKKLAESNNKNNQYLEKINSDRDGIEMLKNEIRRYEGGYKEKSKELELMKEKTSQIAQNVVKIVNKSLEQLNLDPRFLIKGNRIQTIHKDELLKIDKNRNTNKGMSM